MNAPAGFRAPVPNDTGPFYDLSLFPWMPRIAENWTVIRDELLGLQDGAFSAWPERHIYNKGWNVFGLYVFSIRLDRHCDMVPKTTALIETIPGLATAAFSRLAPRAHIKPHAGFAEGLLRLHVPLICPPGCLLRVEDQVQEWRDGECFVFDDARVHEAWNGATRPRTVLIVDFRADDLVRVNRKPRKVEKAVRRFLGMQAEYTYRR
jgi:beta-hydroxylase